MTNFPKFFHVHRGTNRTLVTITGELVSDDHCDDLAAELQGATDIELRVNSPGGDSYVGFRLYDLLKGRCKIATITGHCYSAAVLPLMAAQRTEAYPDVKILIHPMRRYLLASAEEMISAADGLRELQQRYASVVQKRTGRPMDTVYAWTNAETYFNAEEAKAAGLIDDIVLRPPEVSAPSPVPGVTVPDDAPAATNEPTFWRWLKAFGPVSTNDRRKFARELQTWIACNVSQPQHTQAICQK